MLFFRIIQHLLPTGEAWRTTVDKTLRKLFVGLSSVGGDAREFVDLVYLDLFPATTRELAEWERFYGLTPAASVTEEQRRLALAAEWRATGGQSPAYIQGVIQAAGFDVWIHECWEPGGPPWVARDPRDYVGDALAGSMQCGEPFAECGDPDAQCNNFLIFAGDANYWDNLNLSPIAPPPLPADSAKWPFFIYFGGQTFPLSATVPADRMPELRRLIQKLKPAQNWVVLLASDDEEFLTTETGEELLTEAGVEIAA
jgi:hypothetical protein